MIPENGRVIIRVPNWIGDVIMSLPAIHTLKAKRRDISITAIAKPWVGDLLKADPAIDDLIIYTHRRGIKRLKDTYLLTQKLKKKSPDIAILFQTAFESAFVPWLARIPVRIGRPTDGRRFLLTHSVKFNLKMLQNHQTNFYIQILKSVVDIESEMKIPTPKLFLGDTHIHSARQYIQEINPQGPLIAIAPGAAYGEVKRWPPERYADVAASVVSNWNATVIVCGSEGDQDLANIITNNGNRKNIYNLTGKIPLMTQAALIKMADVAIANDSGLMHVAYSVGTSVIAIFGPTRPEATGPIGDHHVVLHKPPDCAPCKLKPCPIENDCMKRISTREVLSAISNILSTYDNKLFRRDKK